jgi:hypothetical protein
LWGLAISSDGKSFVYKHLRIKHNLPQCPKLPENASEPAVAEVADPSRAEKRLKSTRFTHTLSAGKARARASGGTAKSGRWEAVLGPYGASVRIGLYPTEEAAARAYDEAAFIDCPGLRGIIGNFRDEMPPSGGRCAG